MMIKAMDLGKHFNDTYEIGQYINKGGNGTVFIVNRKADKKSFAIKYLHQRKKSKWYKKCESRFVDEIKTLRELHEAGNRYVINVIDYNITKDGLLWYIMPLGKTIIDYFTEKNSDFYEKMNYMLEIAEGLKGLHEKNYCHRDIKPNNILVVDGQIKLADFGLVWHPRFKDRTQIHEKVGAAETIAPEMRENNPDLKHSDKADIYSFAKSIWMILLNRDRAFVDQYGFETIDYLDIYLEQFEDQGIRTLARLNKLIKDCTEYMPVKRPSIDDVILELKESINDNELSELEISRINEIERIQNRLQHIPSDRERYEYFEKIALFLDGIFEQTTYSFVKLNQDEEELKFTANKIQRIGMENAIIFVDTKKNKRYLVKVKSLEVNKEKNVIILSVTNIEIANIKADNTYEYVDYYSTDFMSKLLGESLQQVENKKAVVDVMTKEEQLVLKIV